MVNLLNRYVPYWKERGIWILCLIAVFWAWGYFTPNSDPKTKHNYDKISAAQVMGPISRCYQHDIAKFYKCEIKIDPYFKIGDKVSIDGDKHTIQEIKADIIKGGIQGRDVWSCTISAQSQNTNNGHRVNFQSFPCEPYRCDDPLVAHAPTMGLLWNCVSLLSNTSRIEFISDGTYLRLY